MREDRERLLDIRDAIERIERYSARGRAAFDAEELVQTWIVHPLQIIGEAARGLTQPFRLTHPEIPWIQIVGMRNVLVHSYFDLDLDEIWVAVERSVPELKAQVAVLLAALENGCPEPKGA